jgi:hypothetical protein
MIVMTEKEMRKLSRADLLELLIEQSQEVQQLRTWLNQVEAKLVSRHIAIADAGSIAEAALKVNGVFEAAQAASEQYLDNIRNLSKQQDKICAQMERECQARIDQRLAETEKKCAAMEIETKAQCEAMIANAKADSQIYWDEVSNKLEAFYQEHENVRKLLSVVSPRSEASV